MRREGFRSGNTVGPDRSRGPVRQPTPTALPDLPALVRPVRLLTQHHPETTRHCRRVRCSVLHLAEVYGLERRQRRLLSLAARLHDLGKLFYPLWLLDKPGPLSPAEYLRLQEHSALGARLLANTGAGHVLVAAVRGHHERFDGGGYPDGLRGRQIPLLARLLTVADCYDAMTGPRSYRPPLSPAAAREDLRRGAGSQFDPEAVAAFLEVLPRLSRRNGHGQCPIKRCPMIQEIDPKSAPRAERRRWPRHPWGQNRSLRLIVRHEEAALWARTRDLSVTGLGLVLPRPVEPGVRFVIELRPGPGPERLSLLAEVVRVEARSDGSWDAGCTYDSLAGDLTLAERQQLLESLRRWGEGWSEDFPEPLASRLAARGSEV
jgi:hypothetical protein